MAQFGAGSGASCSKVRGLIVKKVAETLGGASQELAVMATRGSNWIKSSAVGGKVRQRQEQVKIRRLSQSPGW